MLEAASKSSTTSVPPTVGVRLLAARQRKGMTQQDLAYELDLNHNTISRWELGLHPIKPKYHKRLIEILGMKPEDFNLY